MDIHPRRPFPIVRGAAHHLQPGSTAQSDKEQKHLCIQESLLTIFHYETIFFQTLGHRKQVTV